MGFKAWYDNRADDLTKEVRRGGQRLRVCALLQQPMHSEAATGVAPAWREMVRAT